jgi:hypothetical protein
MTLVLTAGSAVCSYSAARDPGNLFLTWLAVALAALSVASAVVLGFRCGRWQMGLALTLACLPVALVAVWIAFDIQGMT